MAKGQKTQAANQAILEKLKQHNHELAVLKAITEELNRAVDVKSALEAALRLVGNLFGLKSGWVWLLDEASAEPYLAASLALPPFLAAKPARMRGPNCLCLRTFLAGDVSGAANVNVLECSRLAWEVDSASGLRYHASIPIYSHDKPLGIMNVASSDWRRLEENDLQLLYIIGYQIGIAVERARLFDQTARLATAEERNRLAREIHDTIAQGMAAAILNLESAEVLLEEADPARQKRGMEKLRKALALTRLNLEEARRSVLDLRAAPLQENLLAGALAALVGNLGTETGMEASFSLKGSTSPNRRYPARLEAGIYRVAQEALTNVKKHARARLVSVTLQAKLFQGKETLKLAVQDDGIGFDPSLLEPLAARPALNPPGPASHFGLTGMNERARLLGGHLEVETCPGKGTFVRLEVPLS